MVTYGLTGILFLIVAFIKAGIEIEPSKKTSHDAPDRITFSNLGGGVDA
jgi:hypothetical protein